MRCSPLQPAELPCLGGHSLLPAGAPRSKAEPSQRSFTPHPQRGLPAPRPGSSPEPRAELRSGISNTPVLAARPALLPCSFSSLFPSFLPACLPSLLPPLLSALPAPRLQHCACAGAAPAQRRPRDGQGRAGRGHGGQGDAGGHCGDTAGHGAVTEPCWPREAEIAWLRGWDALRAVPIAARIAARAAGECQAWLVLDECQFSHTPQHRAACCCCCCPGARPEVTLHGGQSTIKHSGVNIVAGGER